MTSSNDSTKHLKWWTPDIFHSTLYEVDGNNPRNKKVAELVHSNGGIRTTVKTQSDIGYELRIRALCKVMEGHMRESIAKWVAKKLT